MQFQLESKTILNSAFKLRTKCQSFLIGEQILHIWLDSEITLNSASKLKAM